jgi:chromosome segregation ATPase
MAGVMASRAKKRGVKLPPTELLADAAGGEGARVAELEAECARLRAELAEAQARLGELEAQRKALANRIDWVIDSLHSLLDE